MNPQGHNLLALDLGTKTGWAMLLEDGARSSGTWTLAKPEEIKQQRQAGKDRTGDARVSTLVSLLSSRRDTYGINHVIFEDVLFSTTTMQTQLWASLRTAMWIVFPPSSTKFLPVAVGTLKKFATGHGAATKLMMGAWLVRKHPELFRKRAKPTLTSCAETLDGRAVDDNESDANHLLDYYVHYHRRQP